MTTQITTKTRSSNINNSIAELNMSAFTRTGSSGYNKGWAKKSVWTDQVCQVLDAEGISYERGNDAARGGANGEYVRITCPAFIEAAKTKIIKTFTEDATPRKRAEWVEIFKNIKP